MEIKEQKDIINVATREAGYEFNGRIWTKSSEPLIWADGVSYCGIRGAKMQTLDDAVEFRHDSNGSDGSADYQHTGTLIAFVNDQNALRAHIYEPEQDELEKLASGEGLKKGSACFMDVDSASNLGNRIIDSTKKTGRTFIVPDDNLKLSVKLSILPVGGVTDYGTNRIVLKLMPRCAEKNAACIAGKGYNTGLVWFDRPNLRSGQMRICPVGLGGDGYYDISYVDADDNFNRYGRSRGLVHVGQKISGETQGLPLRAK